MHESSLRRSSGWLLAAALLAAAPPAASGAGAQAPTPALDLDTLFTERAWEVERFGPARWVDGNHYVTVEADRRFPEADALVRYEAAEGARTVLIEARDLIPPFRSEPLRIEGWQLAPDGASVLIYTASERVWRTNSRGDYWLFDLESRELRQIDRSAPPSSLMFAKFSPDGTRVAYVRENDLWLEDLRSETVTRLTADGSPTLANGTTDWVYEEELGLSDGFRWSPDGRRIAFFQLDDELVREFVLVDYLSDLYPRLQRFPYPKAGEVNPSARIGVIPAGGGQVTWMRLPGSTRDNYVARMDWAASSTELVIQQLNRRQDVNRVFLANASNGEAREILREEDDAWVDVNDDLHWIDGGAAFTWASERDGWRRIYRVDRHGRQLRPLTPEGVDVLSLELVDEVGGALWYRASPEDPTSGALYRAPLEPRPERVRRVSPVFARGTHTYDIAPGADWAIHTYSTFAAPPVTSLVALAIHPPGRPLVDNAALAARVEALGIEPEFFRVDIGDGVELDAWALYPPDFDPSASYPVLFHVYGEPWGQTVLNRWGGRNLLWHHWLTRQGYVVMSVDNRGTPAPRGRAWRKIVYGEVGTLASEDQAAALRRILAERPGLDASRVGVWGWSGGGSMTLNLLFRYPELYALGMAVAPVPDQRYYDSIYQERYMGKPQDNAHGYAGGSPITYAHRLEGDLLLIHGTGDDNVHYQGTEALIDRLVAHGKGFTMMAYPNRSHSIAEGEGTTRHLFGLMSGFLQERLPAGQAVAAAATTGRTPRPPATAADLPRSGAEARIRAARAASNAAIAAGDVAGIREHLADGYHASISSGALVPSPDDMAALFEADAGNAVYVRTPESIELSADGITAAEVGTWVGTIPDGDGTLRLGGRYTASWRREAGRWRIHSELFVRLF